MKRNIFISIGVVSFIAFFINSPQAGALDLRCQKCFADVSQEITALLDELPNHYDLYRKNHHSRRIVLYENVWKYRRLSLHPTRQEKRQHGLAMEKEWLQVADSYNDRAAKQGNAFYNKVSQLSSLITTDLPGCLGLACSGDSCLMSTGLDTLLDVVKSMRAHYEKYYEFERALSDKVMSKIGDEEGLYLLDTLEDPHEHTTYYEAIQRDIEEEMYEQDRQMLMDMQEARILMDKLRNAQCCESCEVHEAHPMEITL